MNAADDEVFGILTVIFVLRVPGSKMVRQQLVLDEIHEAAVINHILPAARNRDRLFWI